MDVANKMLLITVLESVPVMRYLTPSVYIGTERALGSIQGASKAINRLSNIASASTVALTLAGLAAAASYISRGGSQKGKSQLIKSNQTDIIILRESSGALKVSQMISNKDNGIAISKPQPLNNIQGSTRSSAPSAPKTSNNAVQGTVVKTVPVEST